MGPVLQICHGKVMRMAKEVLLSFVLPVYNVENELDECMESILSQMGEQCEIILVDDGSTDRSGYICDTYCGTYDCVTAMHKPNGGLSSARNAGLEAAQGQYVAFVDSDDRIVSGAVPQIIAWIGTNDADICFLNAVKFFPDGSAQPLEDQIEPGRVRNQPKGSVLEYLALLPKYPGSACTKIYRKGFLSQNDLMFPRDTRLSEDLGFCRDCFLMAESFDALTMPYYEYRQSREGSITSTVTLKSFQGLELFIRETVEQAAEHGPSKDETRACMLSFAAYEYSIVLWQYSQLPMKDHRKVKEFLDRYRWVLRYGRTMKLTAVRTALDLLGTRRASRLLDFYMSHR